LSAASITTGLPIPTRHAPSSSVTGSRVDIMPMGRELRDHHLY
jgi:hypothetical protein